MLFLGAGSSFYMNNIYGNSFKFSIFISCVLPSLAANAGEFEGIVEMKPWSKSVESFCAGGSEYFVLNTESGTYIISYQRSVNITQNEKVKKI